MRYSLTKRLTTIGRDPENDIRICSEYISRKHAVIEVLSGHLCVHDHSSTGTWLNNERLVKGGHGAVLSADDVRVCLPCTLLHPRDCMAIALLSLSDTCLLSTHRILSLDCSQTLCAGRMSPFVYTPLFP